MTKLIAFPGQGVDPVDLGRLLTFHRHSDLVERLTETVGITDLSTIELRTTEVAQPCIFVASYLAAFTHFGPPSTWLNSESEEHNSRIGAVCGHSFGEIAALCFAGAMAPEAGLTLVRQRAEWCQAQHALRPGTMIVVMRLDEHAVEWVRRTSVSRHGGSLDWAVVNGPGQFVLSGDAATATGALEEIESLGGVGRVLPIGGAYHSPLLAPVVSQYLPAVVQAITAEPLVPLVSCTTNQVLTSGADIAKAVAQALVLPVQWPNTLRAGALIGATQAVDTGPGRTLANLARFTPELPFDALSPDRREQSR